MVQGRIDMKKWLISMLLFCMLCLSVGCESAEGKLEKAEELMEEGKFSEAVKLLESIEDVIDVDDEMEDAKIGLKYEYIPKENLRELMKEDLKVIGLDGFAIELIASDAESIEEFLDYTMYGEWYKDGKDKSIEMNEEVFDDIPYGVYYVFGASGEYEAEYTTVIKLYEIGKENNPFYMTITSTYEYGFDGAIVFNYMSLVEADGDRELYRSISQSDYNTLMQESWEIAEMQSMEDDIVSITYNSFKERKEGEYTNFVDTMFHSYDIVDYSIEYQQGYITCNLKVKFNENILTSALGGNSEVYYVVGKFRFDGETAKLISFDVK